MKMAGPIIYEPVMDVEVQAPVSFQGAVVGRLNKRGAIIRELIRLEENVNIKANAPLDNMFGYSSDLRQSH